MSSSGRLAIILNGPPRAGKDTAIEVLQDVFRDAEVYQFFRPIKEMLHADLGLDVTYDHFETVKDEARVEFGGLTPRRAYIAKGEALQAEFGHDILIETYFEAISSCNAPILITTCGNDGEAVEISSIFGNENTLVFRIHKEGHDFSNDSRSWVTSSFLNIRDVQNVHGHQREYQSVVAAIAQKWVETRQPNYDYAA